MKEYRVDIFSTQTGKHREYFDTEFEARKYAMAFARRYINLKVFLLKRNIANRYDILEQIMWKEVRKWKKDQNRPGTKNRFDDWSDT